MLFENLDDSKNENESTGIKKESNSKWIFIIPIMLAVLYLIYMSLMYSIPYNKYKKARNEHKTVKALNVPLKWFYFGFHIFLALFLLFLSYSLLTKFKEQLNFKIISVVVTGSAMVTFWSLCIAFTFLEIFNPRNAISIETIADHINKSNKNYLMGYVYARGNKFKVEKHKRIRYRYSSPYIFKVNVTAVSYEGINATGYPDYLGYEINYNYDNDDTIEYYLNKGREAVKSSLHNNGYKYEDIYFGFYPDYQGIYYISKTGKYTGKYGLSSKIASAIFGVGTYYDQLISSLPYYSSDFNRTLVYYNKTEEPQYDHGESVFKQCPDLEKLYSELYK